MSDNDFESYLRAKLNDTDLTPAIYLNAEGRVEMVFGDGFRFISFGDRVIPVPEKPAAQRVAATGFDAHKGMGDRT